jgi:hypothetical protein
MPWGWENTLESAAPSLQQQLPDPASVPTCARLSGALTLRRR